MSKELDWETRLTEKYGYGHTELREFIKETLTAKEDALRKAVEGMRLSDEGSRIPLEKCEYAHNQALEDVLALLTPKN